MGKSAPESSRFRCPRCRVALTTLEDFESHRCDDASLLHCCAHPSGVCDFTTRDEDHLKRHEDGHKGEPWPKSAVCQGCVMDGAPEPFATTVSAKNYAHRRAKHGAKYKHECADCVYTTTTQRYLDEHIAREHPNVYAATGASCSVLSPCYNTLVVCDSVVLRILTCSRCRRRRRRRRGQGQGRGRGASASCSQACKVACGQPG
jgi:hypothetical protein